VRLTCGFRVLEAGGDEDLAIAALLHDAVEDQGGQRTLQTIRRMFGDRVATVVMECSDCASSIDGEYRARGVLGRCARFQ
jgi:(p)ppGpp synthase/HD superfamily hydrolase